MAKPQLMPFRAGRLAFLAGDGTESASVESKLVESLFAQRATLQEIQALNLLASTPLEPKNERMSAAQLASMSFTTLAGIGT